MEQELRKCACCDVNKKTKSINLENNDYIKYKNKFYHIECFIEKEKNKKRCKLTDDELNKLLIELKRDTEIFKNNLIEKNKFYKWIYENYKITVLSKYLYTKISEINNGNYKLIKESISYEDLLAIFTKMKDYLEKIAYRRKAKGKGFKSQLDRLNYDLAVVVNNYDKYKTWKIQQNKMQLDKNKQIEVIQEKKIYDNLINNKTINTKEDKANIIDIIDELF